jgi:hypothetical protein
MQRMDDLLRSRDAIEVARHGPKAVIGRHRAVAEILDLLQNRIGNTAGEHIARQEKHRQAVHMGNRRRRDHVGGARANR